MKSAKAHITKTKSLPLAVIEVDNNIAMLVRLDKKVTSSLGFLWSKDGLNFEEDTKKVSINITAKKKEKIKDCDKFSISRTPTVFVMTYHRKGIKKTDNKLVVARSKDLYEWKVLSEIPMDDGVHSSIVYDKPRDMFEIYRDGLFIKNQSSRTLSVWKDKPSLLFTSRHKEFDEGPISIIGSIVTREGILMLYDASLKHAKHTLLQVGAVLFDIKNPKRIVWRTGDPTWQGVVEFKDKSEIHPLGFVSIGNTYIMYWISNHFDLIVVKIPTLFKEIEEALFHPKIFNRYKGNPIISPRDEHPWESEGTFNPTVVEDDEGTIHLLYRALGSDGISRVGYAQSKNGTNFSRRSHAPVFQPSEGFGLPDPEKATGPIGYHPAIYTSGGGWGGSEDPRAVRIDGRVYMTYVAFEGWNSVRIALTSISLDDFKQNKWKWRVPKLISPPGQVNKNWLIFPEKFNGKFAIVHSIAPRISIDYVDDLDNLNGYINSPRPEGPQPGRIGHWDSYLRGPGPVPIKTPLGWLLLYHALDKRDSGKYKLGAMLLDKNDPSLILYRSDHPILAPDMHYENNGKPGVIYASGAMVRGEDLYIYYGGADKVVCVATTPLKKFLKYLVSGNSDHYKLKEISV